MDTVKRVVLPSVQAKEEECVVSVTEPAIVVIV
jgi:hypothetical protein